MIEKLLICIFSFSTTCLGAQNKLYKIIELGDLQVAYYDTVLYDSSQKYDQFGYEGPAPIFTQVWYPYQGNPTQYAPDVFEAFQEIEAPRTLNRAYSYLKQEFDTTFVNYAFQSFKNGGRVSKLPVDFGKYTDFEVYELLKKTQTKSHKKAFRQVLDYPIIVYHHGAQGNSYENYLMAEYFASRGFVFISSVYNLAYENKDLGYYSEGFDFISMPKKTLEFARNLSTEPRIIFIGFSMGAQHGFLTLHDEINIEGFISLETTLEFFNEDRYQERWPEIVEVIELHKDDYTFPIMMLANTQVRGIETSFPLFNQISNTPMIHVGSRNFFDHGSYTSLYHMRYLLKDKVHQPDSLNSKSQLEYYAIHLELIEKYINSILMNTVFDQKSFEQDFDFRFFNIRKD